MKNMYVCMHICVLWGMRGTSKMVESARSERHYAVHCLIFCNRNRTEGKNQR